MKFQLTTDYAIRVLHYLHTHQDERPTAEEIAEKTAITYSYLVRVTSQLKKSGLVLTERGRRGGYRLGRSAVDISLYDTVMAIEGNLAISRCLEDEAFCTHGEPDTCPAHSLFSGLQGEVERYLKAHSIADLPQ